MLKLQQNCYLLNATMAIQQLQSAKKTTYFTHHLDKVSIYYSWEMMFAVNYRKTWLSAGINENSQNQARNKAGSS